MAGATPEEGDGPTCIHGWFTTIWGNQPRYFVTDDRERQVELLLDEEITNPLGGPLTLDRQIVTVIGNELEPGLVHPTSITLGGGECP